MVYSLTRFALSGWVEELWIRPDYFFKYEWATWMPSWEPWGLYVHLGVTLAGAVGVMIGLYTRGSLALFILGFTGLQLIDKTNYLNHYYLVACLAVPLALSPAGSAFSLDRSWRGLPAQNHSPAWCLGLLRFQLAIVYLFAALAKVGVDWLYYAQPLSIWLSARGDLPLVGSLIAQPEAAYLMSWCGFLYDLTIVIFLYVKRTRRWAYVVVVSFHLFTWVLFDIGIFPLMMTALTPIFFHPLWPERLGLSLSDQDESSDLTESSNRAPKHHLGSLMLKVFLPLWVTFHLAFPLRTHLLEENVLWSERGMRYSWRVMVREKMGSLTYRVRPLNSTREWEVNPRQYLQPRQLSEMSGQPDMIVELAHWVRQQAEIKLKTPVAVYADSWVSLNGRPPRRFINPDLDLTRIASDDATLILSPPLEPPLRPR
jgi:hypothetical protein